MDLEEKVDYLWNQKKMWIRNFEFRRMRQLYTLQQDNFFFYFNCAAIHHIKLCERGTVGYVKPEHNWDSPTLFFIIEFESGEAQSGEVSSEPEVVEHVQTVTFADHGELDEHTMFTRTKPPPEDTISVNLNAFMERAYPILAYKWTGSDSPGTLKAQIDLPTHLMYDEFYGRKMANIAFWKPDIVIEVRINSTAMHYGKMVAYVYPYPVGLGPSYVDYRAMWSSKWVQVSANGQQTLRVKIPYTHYKNQLSIGPRGIQNPDSFNNDLTSRFCLWVSIPLSNVNGTPVGVPVSVWAFVETPNFRNFTYEVFDFVQAGDVVKISEALAKYDPCNTDIIKTSNNHMPHVSTAVLPICNRFPRQLQCDEKTETMMTTVSQHASISIDYDLVFGMEEDMNMVRLSMHPMLLHLGTITSSMVAGHSLFEFNMNPGNIFYSDYITGTTRPNVYGISYWYYLAKMFVYWRGSFRFWIAICASRFHSARLRVSWQPYVSSLLSQPTLVTGSNMTSIVQDITEESEFGVTIPFQQESDWLIFSAQAFNYRESNGQFYLSLVNELTSSATAVTPIYYQIFVSSGADAQFAMPNMDRATDDHVLITNAPTTFVAEEDMGENETQSLNTRDETELPSLSYETVMHATYPVISQRAAIYNVSRVEMSYEITDLRQLMRLQQILMTLPGNSGAIFPKQDYNMLAFLPGDVTKYLRIQYMYLPCIMAIFRFQRGSTRYTIIGANTLHVSYLSLLRTAQPVEPWLVTTVATPVSQIAMWTYVVSSTASMLDFTIPYYSRYRCAPIIQFISLTPTQSDSVQLLNVTAGSVVSVVTVGAGEDYHVGCLLPVPLHTSVPYA
jgi:hypothetical protein